MTDEQIYRDLKQLQRFSEWKTFEEHVKSVAQIHRDSSVNYSSKGNAVDAQRQAWIAEGLIEAIEEPQNVVSNHEFSAKGIIQTICHFCGNMFKKAA